LPGLAQNITVLINCKHVDKQLIKSDFLGDLPDSLKVNYILVSKKPYLIFKIPNLWVKIWWRQALFLVIQSLKQIVLH